MIYTAVVTEPDLIEDTLADCILALLKTQNPVDEERVANMIPTEFMAYMEQHEKNDPDLTAAVIDGAEPYKTRKGQIVECPVYVVVAVTASLKEGEGPTIADV